MRHLTAALMRLALPCDEKTLEQFETYRRRILEWNRSVNLTAIKDEEAFEIKHFVDSLLIGEGTEMDNVKKVIDVGTGAGFPGIPLAIVYPDKKFTLMDSLGKRMKIVREVAEEIGLSNVEVIHARAEDLAKKKEHREQYDMCVSRAVANLSVLSEYCLPFVRPGGWFAPYKTAAAREEIIESAAALKLLGGKLVSQTSFQEEGLDHLILWIKKTGHTPAKYPRKAGTPSKEPLK